MTMLPLPTYAASSANYTLQRSSLASGGGASSSANYSMEFSVGQVIADGESSSANYSMVSGFFAGRTSTTTPVVSETAAATSITINSAESGGAITDNGGAAITQHGVCWSTTPSPTITDSKTEQGATTPGSFTSSLTGLVPNTPYYVRAYATNSEGTSYGNEVTFTTFSDGGDDGGGDGGGDDDGSDGDSSDSDGDGVPDDEDEYPNDATVATVDYADGGGQMEISCSSGQFVEIAAVNPNAGSLPDGMPEDTFLNGLVEYKVTGIAAGATVTITIEYDSPIPSDARVYKVNDDEWVDITDYDNALTAVSISGSTLTLTLTDGEYPGDADELVNGEIVDPVGVAVPEATASGDSGDSGGGGGCSLGDDATFNAIWIAMLLGCILMGLAGMRKRIRKN